MKDYTSPYEQSIDDILAANQWALKNEKEPPPERPWRERLKFWLGKTWAFLRDGPLRRSLARLGLVAAPSDILYIGDPEDEARKRARAIWRRDMGPVPYDAGGGCGDGRHGGYHRFFRFGRTSPRDRITSVNPVGLTKGGVGYRKGRRISHLDEPPPS